MSQHVFSVKTNLTVFAVLMGLLVLTVVAAYLPLGVLHTPMALTIAFIKTIVIATWFMHLRYSNKLIWLLSGTSIVWLGLLVFFFSFEYRGRAYLQNPDAVADGAEYFGVPQATVDDSVPAAERVESDAPEASHDHAPGA